MFTRFTIEKWRQFEALDLAFHPRLTVLTGANGAGKSTVLGILSRHLGWQRQFVSTPTTDKKGVLGFLSDAWKFLRQTSPPNEYKIGEIHYQDAPKSDLFVPHNVSTQYEVRITNQIGINGIYIPSHRIPFIYRGVPHIPTSFQGNTQLFQVYVNDFRSRSLDGGGHPPNFRLKEALISLAVFGYGNQVVTPNPSAIETFEGFERILLAVLPPQIGFQKISIRLPEVALTTTSGEFSLDAVSGGVAAIIDLAWQIYMSSLEKLAFVVLIDEPENHLHPEMQRTILPNFLKAFPKAQFIVTTHNPFIVGSVQESSVYVLNYNNTNKVVSYALDMINRAGSSNEILREVLGLPVTVPLWVETRLEELIKEFSTGPLNEESFGKLRKRMAEIGLERLFPEALGKIVKSGEKNDKTEQRK